ncbi:hypothetical protein ACPA9J_04600 [Pseudomonas aeruginosa]
MEIKGADLLGFGGEFLVAYGNRRFVGRSLAPWTTRSSSAWSGTRGRTNLPLVKMFYIAEPGLLSSLLNLSRSWRSRKNRSS